MTNRTITVRHAARGRWCGWAFKKQCRSLMRGQTRSEAPENRINIKGNRFKTILKITDFQKHLKSFKVSQQGTKSLETWSSLTSVTRHWTPSLDLSSWSMGSTLLLLLSWCNLWKLFVGNYSKFPVGFFSSFVFVLLPVAQGRRSPRVYNMHSGGGRIQSLY